MSTANVEAGGQQSTTRDQIREFIRENLASTRGVSSFTDTESLTENGIVDSLGIFRLVAFLEDDLGVRLSDEEITSENLSSVERIEQLVARKMKK
ncbi:MAG TPA: acyl carrier protein [Terriglobales bacterium]|nr:acyl carrier protein [Terriglobales bacterium]